MTEYRAKASINKRGFALVIILSLTALLVLIFLSMSTLGRVETGATQTRLYQKQARDNALFALRLAIGKIQRHAGPDQRVTARADFLTNDSVNPFWSGVWNVDTQSPDYGDVTWLVSGKNPDPSVAVADKIVLVGKNTASEIITLPREPLFVSTNSKEVDSGLETRGHYAFWVSDESIKASIAKINRSGVVINYRDKEERVHNRQLGPWKTGGEVLFPGLNPLSEGYESVNSNLRRIHSLSQLQLITGLVNEANSNVGEITNQYFHDLTTVAFGVLANTLTGPDAGLKRDLSLQPFLLGSGFESYLDFHRYQHNIIEKSESTLPVRHYYITPFDSDITQMGEILHTVSPVLTEALFQNNIRSDIKSAKILARLRCLFELWNPYTSEILLGLLNAGDLELAVTGLPVISVVDSNGGNTSINLQRLFGDSSKPDNPLVIRLPFPAEERWLPGRIFNWAGAPVANFDSRRWNLNAITMGKANGLDTSKSANGPIRSKTSNDTRFEISNTEQTSLNLKLSLRLSENERALLADYRDIRFSKIDVAPYKHWHKPMNFGFHFRLKEPIDSHVHPVNRRGQWLADHDPRDPVLSSSAFTSVQGVTPAEPELFGGVNVKTSAPSHIFDRRSGPNFRQPSENIPLFELPRQDSFSLGSLQHLFISGERPFSIGNRWSSKRWRSIFDLYFLSVFPRNGDYTNFDPKLPLPNPWLILHGNNPMTLPGLNEIILSGTGSGRYFLIEGAFNVNSTSIQAWKSVLNSLKIKNWNFLELDNKNATPQSTSTIDLAASYLRLSQSAQETYNAPDVEQDPYDTGATVFPTKIYRRGLRGLSSNEVDKLAEGIVERLRIKGSKGLPFRTLGEFIGPLDESNSNEMSVIEAAIADIDDIGLWQAEGDIVDIDKFSSYDLSQADIITAIAPFITVRSDTFLIRAYGDILNPVTRDREGQPVTEGRAWCEALVQRLPETVNTHDNIVAPSPDRFGRRFHIIQFRWLNWSDI